MYLLLSVVFTPLVTNLYSNPNRNQEVIRLHFILCNLYNFLCAVAELSLLGIAV